MIEPDALSPFGTSGPRYESGVPFTRERCRAAARSRALGPTTALWHAVELHRPSDEVDDACELTLCGLLARVAIERPWPPTTRDVCPVCLALTR